MGLFLLQNRGMLQLLLWFFCCCCCCFCSSSFSPLDKYFINCGSSTNTSLDDGRDFQGDSSSNYLSATSSIIINNPNPLAVSSRLYHSARVFKGPSSYQFPLQGNGTLVVRLHFFPFSSANYSLSSAVFDVSVSGLQLLSNFSVQRSNSSPREYFLRPGGDKLEIAFTPSPNSPSSFAFVNAIEVFSAPDGLILDDAPYVPTQSTDYNGLLEHALETLYRVNVGGLKITPGNDALWRTWIPDAEFLKQPKAAKQARTDGHIKYQEVSMSPEIAPPSVYGSAQEMNTDDESMAQNFNITWLFPVRPGDTHLVRLHFCDIVSSAPNQLFFHVYIDSDYAIQNLNLYKSTNGFLAAPYFRDFIVDSDNLDRIKVSVGPTDRCKNAILNGVEIMKVCGSAGGVISHPNAKTHAHVMIGLGIAGGLVLIFVMAVCLLAFKCVRRMKSKPKPEHSGMWSPLSLIGQSTNSRTIERTKTSVSPHLNLGLKISFADIQLATENFDTKLLVGTGGFGNVYKGVLRDGTKVAVKRGKPDSSQGLNEFLAEITVLSKIHHRHLVSLIGYCEEHSEMILVYEFMENGPLKDHLYGKDLPFLSWKQRLEICIGSARGIHYLHTCSAQGIVHRDVKTANILLDENFSAKVADFGLSRSVPSDYSHELSTNVKGSFGYLDPEYFKRRHLTQKSDVYSFGVVLLEVLCARRVVDHSLPTKEVSLTEWALQWQRRGQLVHIIDPRLAGTVDPNSLRKFGETAEKCLAEYGVDRPAMGEVLWNLEYALQLQETAVHREPHEDSTLTAFDMPLTNAWRLRSATATAEGDYSIATTDGCSSDAAASRIFSQLLDSDGR